MRPAGAYVCIFQPEILQAEAVKGLMEPNWATLVRRDGSDTTGDKIKRLCRLVGRGTSVRIRFGSPFSSLSLTIKETLK